MSKQNVLEVYKIGTQVKLEEDVYAKIVGICIRDNGYITYECGWWNGRSYDTRLFHPNEFTVTLSEKTRIGFM